MSVSMSGATARVRWLDVWTRAVIVPAWRRAAAVWVGAAIVGGVIFGPSAMHPSDLTELALHHASVAITLGLTWLLVFVPTARILIRADGARYLRSLPGPTIAPRLLAGAALIVLQLPWLLLWVIGEAERGLAIVVGVTLVIVALGSWRPPVMRAKWPGWASDGTALRGIHLRGLRRRAGDALIRGTGLAILAGVAGGLFIRNNQLADAAAATIGASVIAAVLVPAEVGVLMVILTTHRQTAWLAHSLGTTRGTRVGAMVYAVAAVQLGATAVAFVAAILVGELDLSTTAWLGATSAGVAIASSLGCARVLLASEESPAIAMRTVAGSTVVAAGAVLSLGLFGELGVAALFAACVLALATVKGET